MSFMAGYDEIIMLTFGLELRIGNILDFRQLLFGCDEGMSIYLINFLKLLC